mgnify:CR=1 FL=1
MKSTYMIRKIDNLGRIVIPIEIRNKLQIDNKDSMEIYVEGSSIILKKANNCCVFCGNKKDVQLFKNSQICNKCIDNLINQIK